MGAINAHVVAIYSDPSPSPLLLSPLPRRRPRPSQPQVPKAFTAVRRRLEGGGYQTMADGTVARRGIPVSHILRLPAARREWSRMEIRSRPPLPGHSIGEEGCGKHVAIRPGPGTMGRFDLTRQRERDTAAVDSRPASG